MGTQQKRQMVETRNSRIRKIRVTLRNKLFDKLFDHYVVRTTYFPVNGWDINIGSTMMFYKNKLENVMTKQN